MSRTQKFHGATLAAHIWVPPLSHPPPRALAVAISRLIMADVFQGHTFVLAAAASLVAANLNRTNDQAREERRQLRAPNHARASGESHFIVSPAAHHMVHVSAVLGVREPEIETVNETLSLTRRAAPRHHVFTLQGWRV
jgi:hypothetical protein